MTKNPFCCNLGRVLDDQGLLKDVYRLEEDQLSTHATIIGRTGTGKSRLLWNLILEHLKRQRALVLVDPGDLCEDVLASIASLLIDRGNSSLLRRIHYLSLSPMSAFRYNPFAFRLYKPIHPELEHVFRCCWQHARVDFVGEILQGKQGQVNFEGMPRLQRVIRDALIAVSTMVDKKTLTIPDALVLLDVTHPDNRRVVARLVPKLPRDVRSDIETWIAMRRIEDVRRETESTLNRFRSLLTPLLTECFASPGPTLDLFDAIQKGHIVLVHVRKEQFNSYDECTAIGKLFTHDVADVVMATPRELRKPCTLMVDEAWQFASEDLFNFGINVFRKYKLSLILTGLDLKSFRPSKDADHAPKLLGQPETIICFNQRWPEDVKVLVEILFGNDIDWTPLLHEIWQHQGQYDWIDVKETSTSKTTTKNWSATDGHATANATTADEAETTARQASTSVARSLDTPLLRGNETTGGGVTSTVARRAGKSHSETDTHSRTEGGAEAEGETESIKKVHLPRLVQILRETGQLKKSVADQLARFIATIMGLKKRQAIVARAGEKAVVIQTADVPDPFASPEATVKMADWVKRQLRQLHAYNFVPSLDPEEQERRLREFIGARVEGADEPVVVEEGDEGNDETNGNPFGW